jgi:hypothetical protein
MIHYQEYFDDPLILFLCQSKLHSRSDRIILIELDQHKQSTTTTTEKTKVNQCIKSKRRVLQIGKRIE